MADAPALVLRRLVIRTSTATEAETVAAGFRAEMARSLDQAPRWQGGQSAHLRISESAASAGPAAANALRKAVTGGRHG